MRSKRVVAGQHNLMGNGASKRQISAFLGLMALFSVFTMLFPTKVRASSDFTEDDLQIWAPVTLQGSLPATHKRGLYFLEVQPRQGNLDGQQQSGTSSMLLVRGALGYRINKYLSLWQGYGWTPIFKPDFRNESRLFQQVLLESKIKKLQVFNRTRLEQRFIEFTDSGTSIRGRNLLKLVYPVGKSGKWGIVASDELFVNFNSVTNGPAAGYDQNRAFLGLQRKFNPHVIMEAGYMANNVSRRDPLANRMNHVINISLLLFAP
jgi:hypothetical protein